MFENIKWILDDIFDIDGNTFVIRKNISPKNIETCNGISTEDGVTRTCSLCVALNDTVFKNNNKPSYHHLSCKCKNNVYKLKQLTFDFSIEKITKYLFVNEYKKSMMRSMGFTIEDSEEIYDLIKKEVENNFLLGIYDLNILNNHGQHFKVNINLMGKRDHAKEIFPCHIGCVAWPYGKIKIATPIIKD